jgi:acyl-CoA thioesterase I
MRRLFLPVAGMVLALLAACGQKEPETLSGPIAIEADSGDPSAVTQAAPIIVMLGDSLTAGFQLPAGAALPAALQRDFDDKGIKAKFVNAGVSGDTTADGLQRYDWSVTGSNADLLVIALGANDFLNELPAATPRKNLAAILDRAKKDNLPAVLIGVTIPGDAQDEREAAYAAIYPDLSAQYGVPYYPNMLSPIAGRPELLLQDGVHPTAEGVEAMAASIAGFLEPLVKDLT